ncbi:MAG TPA: DUF6088 family protein [Oculatellaceae cyanobacterium]
MAIEFIYRHITRLAPTEIFATRDMLIYGTRGAVDSALSRLVESGFIQRLARGIFVREIPKDLNIEDIAIAKAKAFKIQLKLLPEYFLEKLGVPIEGYDAVYGRSGHSGSFDTIKGRVAFIGYGPRKMHLLDTIVGQAIFALWLLGYKLCREKDVDRMKLYFGREERDEVWRLGKVMPEWLYDLCGEYVQSRMRLLF